MTTGPPNETSPLTKQLSPRPCCSLVSKRKSLSPFLAFGGDWGDPCQSSLSAWKTRHVWLPEFSHSLPVWLAHGTPKATGCVHRGGGSHVPLGRVRTCCFSMCFSYFPGPSSLDRKLSVLIAREQGTVVPAGAYTRIRSRLGDYNHFIEGTEPTVTSMHRASRNRPKGRPTTGPRALESLRHLLHEFRF